MTDSVDGTSKIACAACHRRKLKCDRKTPGCSTCRRSNIPCLYTAHTSDGKSAATTREGRRKSRGPYRKGKTPREKELEHVVDLLRKQCDDLKSYESQLVSNKNTLENIDQIVCKSSQSYETPYAPGTAATSAMVVPAQHHRVDQERSMTHADHPPSAQILELWLIYISKVDPIAKVLHVPTTTPKILDAIDNLHVLDPGTQALLLSIYLSSLNACEPEHVVARFGAQKDRLMSKYQSALEALISAVDPSSHVSLDALTGTVIYLGCRRRQLGPGNDVPAIFNLAVTLAQRLGIDNPEAYEERTPLECEIWRRLWWTICRHESAYAEEGQMRATSVVLDTDVPLPGNFNDDDLTRGMKALPAPRIGLTECSFTIVMLEIVKLFGQLRRTLKETYDEGDNLTTLHAESSREHSKRIVDTVRARIERGTLSHCDISRPLDWMTLLVAKVTLTKVEIFLLEPPLEADVVATDDFHSAKISLSLDVLECHRILLQEPKLQEYQWVYRPSQQWHALTYVLTELARRPGASFADRAWKAADFVLSESDVLNKHGMTPATRTKLLVAHGSAIEARERWLKRVLPASHQSPSSDSSCSRILPTMLPGRGSETPSEPILKSREPWQFASSLFDVQDARLNPDSFFWPST